MNGTGIAGLSYLGIGLLITVFVMDGKSFPEGTKAYQKALGWGYMILLWPIVICVIGPRERP